MTVGDGPHSPYSRFDSLPQLLAHRAETTGAQPAVTVHGETYSYAQLWDRSGRVQAWLADRGVARGDRVALLLRNSVEFLDAWFGLARLGAVAVPLNTASAGAGLAYCVEHSGAVGIIGHADLMPALASAGRSPRVRWQVAVDGAGDRGPDAGSRRVGRDDSLIAFDRLLDPANGVPDPREVGHLDPTTIVYTSGTTGPPKGVVLPHLSYVNTGGYFAHHLGLTTDDVLHTCLPLFHCNAQQTTLMAGLALGARVVIDRSFSLSRFWSWIDRSDATVTNLLGSMLALLAKHTDAGLKCAERLRYVVAAPVPEDLHRPLEARLGVQIIEGYGLSETGTMACINPPSDVRPGTIGVPLEFNELRIVDGDDHDLPAGTPGQILVRSSIAGSGMIGYHDEADLTSRALAGGWFHTGDVGLRRPDGYYVFVDRLNDAIRRRGENISSFLVETAVLGYPGVSDVAAVGVPSELSEEDLMLVVVTQRGARIAESELADFCATQLGEYMRPRYVALRDSLPRTETGRVQKYLLRKGGPAGAWDGESAGVRR